MNKQQSENGSGITDNAKSDQNSSHNCAKVHASVAQHKVLCAEDRRFDAFETLAKHRWRQGKCVVIFESIPCTFQTAHLVLKHCEERIERAYAAHLFANFSPAQLFGEKAS